MYTRNGDIGATEIYDKKRLPADTERRYGPGYEEVFIPAAAKVKPADGVPLKEVSEMDAWTREVFAGTRQLNPMQSRVFQTAYHSSENMLVRAYHASLSCSLEAMECMPLYFYRFVLLPVLARPMSLCSRCCN